MSGIASTAWRTGLLEGVAILIVVGFLVMPADGRGGYYRAPRKTFDGPSTKLKSTAVLPTLDTPLPEKGNAVWCASFQFAWNALRNKVVKAPIQVANAEAVAERLNGAPAPVVPASAYYATAGRVTPDFLKGIRDTMKRRFRGAPVPELEYPENSILAYAYLSASVKFAIPFFENDEVLAFTDAAGRATKVASFGLRAKDDYAYDKLRKQVAVLHAAHMYERDRTRAEFILDPDRSSKPFQLLLARVPRLDTLAKTVASVDEKIKASRREDAPPGMGPNDVLLVPSMHWRITHHFAELEGEDKKLLNAGWSGWWIDEAMQGLEFKLDKSGADLKSEAKLHCMPIPAMFVFDGPFLVLMRKRGSSEPFLAVWIDDAELLSTR